MVRSSWCGCTPRPTDSAPCGSKSTSSTRRPNSASAAPRLMVDVVLPTPPFWLHSAMIRAGPCRSSGVGSGSCAGGLGRVPDRRSSRRSPARRRRSARRQARPRPLGPPWCRCLRAADPASPWRGQPSCRARVSPPWTLARIPGGHADARLCCRRCQRTTGQPNRWRTYRRSLRTRQPRARAGGRSRTPRAAGRR